MDIRLTTAAVELVPADLTRSLDFYRLLGLSVPGGSAGPPNHVEVELPGGNRLLFDTEDTIAIMHPGWTAPSGPGRIALAFGVASAAEVDELFGRIVAAGHRGLLEPFDAPWGQRYASVADPDGSTVDLYAPADS
jgi:catechol 2,3-dioxygenase-like lactoylglutathione lyase family enzyme